MIKIIQIITSIDMGGAERVATNISKSKNKEFEYHLVEVVKSDSPFSDTLKKELQREKIHYHCSPIKNKKLAIVLFPFWFANLYTKISPDIIHTHTEVPDLALWIFRKIAWIFFQIKPEYIRTIHNTQLWNEWGKLGNIVERFYLKHNCNIAISTSTRDCYMDSYGGRVPPIIYNGLEKVKQKIFPDLKQGKTNILFAGRLEYQKGIDELITTVTALQKDERFHFYIVGSGSMEEKVKNALNDFPHVSIYDKIFGINQYLGSFDYLFMPSNHEGLGLMSIEASLAYTPTIINACIGLKETLPANWKLSVEKNSVPDFIDLIVNKLDIYNYNELAEEAYQFASKHFSIDIMQKEYEKFYQERGKA